MAGEPTSANRQIRQIFPTPVELTDVSPAARLSLTRDVAQLG